MARVRDTERDADVLVVFVITGDLAKMMTFRSLYRLERRELLDCPIVGVAVDDWTKEQLVERARESIAGTGEELDEAVFARFSDGLSYVEGDFGDAATYTSVANAIGEAKTPVFYLEIPPFLFGPVVEGLAGAGLTKTSRVVVEKPFGHDLASARTEPNQLVVKLDPTTGFRLVIDAHRADINGTGRVELDLGFAAEGGEGPTPYEVLLLAALQGNPMRFTRQDAVEQAWRVFQPLLDAPPPVHRYASGSWGPEEAEKLVQGHGAWYEPWIAA